MPTGNVLLASHSAWDTDALAKELRRRGFNPFTSANDHEAINWATALRASGKRFSVVVLIGPWPDAFVKVLAQQFLTDVAPSFLVLDDSKEPLWPALRSLSTPIGFLPPWSDSKTIAAAVVRLIGESVVRGTA